MPLLPRGQNSWSRFRRSKRQGPKSCKLRNPATQSASPTAHHLASHASVPHVSATDLGPLCGTNPAAQLGLYTSFCNSCSGQWGFMHHFDGQEASIQQNWFNKGSPANHDRLSLWFGVQSLPSWAALDIACPRGRKVGCLFQGPEWAVPEGPACWPCPMIGFSWLPLLLLIPFCPPACVCAHTHTHTLCPGSPHGSSWLCQVVCPAPPTPHLPFKTCI